MHKRLWIVAMAITWATVSISCSSHDDAPHTHAKSVDEVEGIQKIDIVVEGKDYNHVDAYYRTANIPSVSGRKIRVIIIPGAPSDVRYWGEAIHNIDAAAEIFAIERAGYEGSGPDRAVTQLDEQADTLRSLIKGYKGEVVIIGQSYGAAIALMALKKYGDSVDELFLVSPYIIPMHGKKKFWFNVARYSFLRFVGGASTNRVVQELSAYKDQSADVEEVAKTSCTPVHILHGELDELVPLEDAFALEGLFPECAQAKLEIVKAGDHFLQVHSLMDVTNSINTFLHK